VGNETRHRVQLLEIDGNYLPALFPTSCLLLGWRSNETKGTKFDLRSAFQLTQYADDTTIFLRDVHAVTK